MEALVAFLVFCQALGASAGAFFAVWGELAYVRAMRDGKIDTAERAHLRVIAGALRWGMSLILLASFGLVIVAYLRQTADQPAFSASYWMLIALALLIILISWALSRRRVSFALGSAILFTGWWFLAYLTLGWFPGLSFMAAVAFFIVAAVVFYALLQYARLLALRKD